MLDRQSLTILRAIARQGTLTAAADELHLTQSAVSHALKRLEHQLGLILCRKAGRRLEFTQAGLQLVKLAERMLPQFEHAEQQLKRQAAGLRGTLRIGMECHPCFQWLQGVLAPYLKQWSDVDVDVKQKFKFGGLGALFDYEIDMLVTPDPLYRTGLRFYPVFDYEQVLVFAADHPFSQFTTIQPEQLASETLLTYPVETSRLDIYAQFLTPASIAPKRHQTIETTDILLQLVASGRGVTALPGWLVQHYQRDIPLAFARLGEQGIQKTLHLGIREEDSKLEYLQAFMDMAKGS